MTQKILITGGAGYIGSHTAVELMNAGHHVVIVDNLCNSSRKVLDRIQNLAGANFSFVEADVRNASALDQIFKEHSIEGVIHFAGLKAVGESVAQPVRYFDNNIGSTLSLLQAMDRQRKAHCVQLVCHGLWRPRPGAHYRSQPTAGYQPLRPHQANVRRHPKRLTSQHPSHTKLMASSHPELLQPRRRAH